MDPLQTRTRELLEKRNVKVETLDISEFRKAEAGLSCLSLIFDNAS
jgi:N-dimethylarginine dimethylaminohydrolase